MDQVAKRLTISAGDLTSCPRGVYYKKKKTPEPLVHPKIAQIWQLFGMLAEKGKIIQQRVMREWQSQGVLLSPERFIPWNDFISGKYDAIVRIDGEMILYEVKGGGKAVFNNKLEKPEPYDEHRLQVILYHYFLKGNFPGLKPRILYVERSGDRRLEIPIEYEDQEILILLEKAKVLKESIESDVLPEPTKTIAWNKFLKKHDISMAAITCKYHALCLKDDHWYTKAIEEATKKNG